MRPQHARWKMEKLMNLSEEQTWNSAAARVVQMIYTIFAFEYSEDKDAGLKKVRDTYDVLFHNFYQKPEALAGAELSMINLGAVGLAAAARTFPDFYTESELTETLCRKQADYGPENISKFGRDGILVRMHDKIARLENLTTQKNSPNNESIRDNYMDVIGYCSVGALWESGEFLLPLTVVERNENSPLPQG